MTLAVLVPAPTTRLTTPAAVLAYLPTADPARVDALIDGASAFISAHTHRVWGRETVIETLPGSGTRYLGLQRAPVLSVGTVTEDGGTITDYSVADVDAASLYRADGWSWRSGRLWEPISYSSGYILPGGGDQRYTVSYTAGYGLPGGTVTPVTLPADVQQAAIVTVQAWYQAAARDPNVTRKQVGDVSISYGAVASSAMGLPPLAEALLRPWVRQPFEPGR